MKNGGRKAKPVDLLILDNDIARYSKKELEKRKAVTVDLGGLSLELPRVLYGKKKASKRFKEIVQLYFDGGLVLVTDADLDILVEYCLNYEALRDAHLILDTYKTTRERMEDLDAYTKSLNNVDKLQTKMMRLSDFLYLNPTSRARTGGAAPTKPKETPLEQKGFGNL